MASVNEGAEPCAADQNNSIKSFNSHRKILLNLLINNHKAISRQYLLWYLPEGIST
jgi:hypothetical protein